MVNITDMVRRADELHDQASKETDPNIRNRLNRMADTYKHIADSEAEQIPASIYGLMSVLTQREQEPPKTRRSRRYWHRLLFDHASQHISIKLGATRLLRLIYLSRRPFRHNR